MHGECVRLNERFECVLVWLMSSLLSVGGESDRIKSSKENEEDPRIPDKN